jgi:MoaA/NifB/PqqE/SkfB family radical SAM enzyme
MILDLVSFAHQCGKRVTLITNGFWATNMDVTMNKLKSLKESGLNHLSISFDTYHLQYIPILNIKNILKVAQRIDLPITLSMVKIKNEKVGFLLDKLEGELYGVPFEMVPCLPAGRANKCFNDNDFDRRLRSSDKGLRCYYAGNLVVGYDGYIYPCCSQMSMSTGLQIGNFNEISLKDALYKAKNNSLLYLIRNMDMSVFVEYAKSKQVNLPNFVVHQCELCPYLFSKENLTIYKELVKSEIQKIKHTL